MNNPYQYFYQNKESKNNEHTKYISCFKNYQYNPKTFCTVGKTKTELDKEYWYAFAGYDNLFQRTDYKMVDWLPINLQKKFASYFFRYNVHGPNFYRYGNVVFINQVKDYLRV